MVLGKLYNFLGLVKWKIIIPKSWDCGEDEMREYMCPKEVPISDLRYASVGFIQSQALLEGPWSRLIRSLCTKRKNTPMVSKTICDMTETTPR